MSILIKNATIVTMDPQRRVLSGNLFIEQDKIAAIGETPDQAGQVIDATGLVAIPGLIQTHVHLCQTLFRGQADDLELLDWLHKRIWPLEGAHDRDSIYYSALLGIEELFRGGTTAIVDMESVHHTGAALEAIRESGIRAISGKCMMDYGDDVPLSLLESTEESLQESVDLLEKWHNRDNGRIRYAFTPRFVVSCSDRLLQEVQELSRKYGVKVHTHASENRGECAAVEADRGMRNVEYLDHIGLTGPELILVHCVWLSQEEMEQLARSRTAIVHCPSSNLKLASGIARIPELLSRGVTVSLGADGAPSNNTLNQFVEMRLAALIHKPGYGPAVMPAGEVFAMATINGAKTMGLEKEIGSLEVGKKADLALIDFSGLHHQPVDRENNIYSQLVYQTYSSDVTTTIVDGKIVMDQRRLTTINEEEVRKNCRQAITRVARRAGLIA